MDEEIAYRDVDSKKFLERALERGTQIEKNLLKDKALTPEEAADLVKALMDEQSDMVKAKQHLVDKLYEAKVREIKKNEVMAAEKIKQLNSEKAKLREKEKKVLEDKAVFEQLRGRGVEFLKEIEMGNAPPIDAIKKNLPIDIKAVQVGC